MVYIDINTYKQIKTDISEECKNIKQYVIDFAIYIIEYFEKNKISITKFSNIFLENDKGIITFVWDREEEEYYLIIKGAYIDFSKVDIYNEEHNIFKIDLTELNFCWETLDFRWLDLNKIDIIIQMLELKEDNYINSRNNILKYRKEYSFNKGRKELEPFTHPFDSFKNALYILNYLKSEEHKTGVKCPICTDSFIYMGDIPYGKSLMMKFEYCLLYLFDNCIVLYTMSEEDNDINESIPETILCEDRIIELCKDIIKLEKSQ